MPPKEESVTVNVDDFTRTRDSVILSLATLQSAVSDLSRAYINHANTVLNRGPSNIDLGGITANLLENGILSGQQHGATPAPALAAGDGKRKRARRYHDPNAPKRALTPFFLYMHHNRQAIAKELGDTAKAKDVSEEGTRRWQTMADSEKQIWKNIYADNLAVYQEKMKAYKEGRPIPEDEEASRQLLQGVHQATEEGSSDDSSSSEEEEEQEEGQSSPSPEPVREPTPPRSSKRRRTTNEIKNITAGSPPSSAKKASPEKKNKKGSSNGKKEEAPSEKAKRTAVETPNKADKRSKRKRRSGAVDED